MSPFNISDHIDKLKPDGGKDRRNGDKSYVCPNCDGNNFLVNEKSGKYYCVNGCSTKQVRDAIEPPINPNKTDTWVKPPRPKDERSWVYTDKDGTPLIKVVRKDDGAGNRDFFQKPLIAGKQPKELRPDVVPYNLDAAILDITLNGLPYVFAVEGESCVDALKARGLPAIAFLGGTGGFIPERDKGHVDDTKLVICPDRDKVGLKYAEKIAAVYPNAKWLYADPTSVEWNGSCPPDKGFDIADWIAQGATNEHILKAIGPKRQPKKPEDKRPWDVRNQRKLSLDRRLECLETCIASLCQRERNTLKRLGKVREVHHALTLKTAIKANELGQMILESLDERSGNSYRALSAEERRQLPEPKVDWLIHNVVPANDLTFIGGRPKVGKTRIAKHLVRALVKAEDFLGFGAPPQPKTVILVTDDQADGDTASMLQQLGIWDNPNLLWSRRFRVTQRNIDRLLQTITEHPDAVVIIDSLRSVTRSCSFDENSPDMGSLIYDLKQSVIDAGSSIILIHHCNKSNDTVGVEALSGHNAIAGSGNTVLTLHYLQDGNKLLKKDSRRRLVREARSGAPFDAVVHFDEASGLFTYVADFDSFTEQQQQADTQAKAIDLISNGTEELQASLRYLQALFNSGGAPGAGLLDLAKQAGIAPQSVRATRDLNKDETTAYRKLGRHLDKLDGVICRLEPNDEIPYPLYCLTADGNAMVSRIFGL